MCTAAEVSGAPSTRPTIPKMLPKPIVAMRTTSGLRSSVAPKAIGCTMFWSSPFARITITSMISAVSVPPDDRARSTASVPDTKAPMKGM